MPPVGFDEAPNRPLGCCWGGGGTFWVEVVLKSGACGDVDRIVLIWLPQGPVESISQLVIVTTALGTEATGIGSDG